MNTVWLPLLNDPRFLKELSTQGHSTERNFMEYKTRYRLRLSGYAPNYLSIDFHSIQSKELRDKNCFVIRTGKGNFVIFDENRFEKPYLDLDLSGAEELSYEIPENFEHLEDAFKENPIENSSIEHLWFLGVFKQIIGRISLENECYIGPRGGKRSTFDVYFKDKKTQEVIKVFIYEGQEDLDYSIFTENCIYFFEGKNFPDGRGGLDLGWHKVIFPASRFKKYSNKRLIPGYFLKLGTVAYFAVFPDFQFFNGGVILNDEKQFIPKQIFKIDLKKY
ncbi:hypothetical protein EQO05_06710 [Methanosarcina sp. MSH10X1]|nr:hypothetical protein EQO05_06710 [Methanosarcina sp. MSH10X1]